MSPGPRHRGLTTRTPVAVHAHLIWVREYHATSQGHSAYRPANQRWLDFSPRAMPSPHHRRLYTMRTTVTCSLNWKLIKGLLDCGTPCKAYANSVPVVYLRRRSFRATELLTPTASRPLPKEIIGLFDENRSRQLTFYIDKSYSPIFMLPYSISSVKATHILSSNHNKDRPFNS